MGQKTKIEWSDATFNPITGCLRGCDYCYARRIATRFGGGYNFVADLKTDQDGNTVYAEDGTPVFERLGAWPYEADGTCHVLDHPANENDAAPLPNYCEETEGRAPRTYPYPWYFDPTFHRYKLGQPQHWRKPRNIFVCSMADLFGWWIPDEWIEEVFAACQKAPQHRYMFLTKNPLRYLDLSKAGKLPKQDNFWYGTTITNPDTEFFYSEDHNTFLSIEPLLEEFSEDYADGLTLDGAPKWIIVGAMTGPGSKNRQPKREWVDAIAKSAQGANVAVFMKDSLIPIVGEENMLRQFPWDRKEDGQ